jgi:chromate reductase, NAD(P)H dehydrogenase (quinone)
MRVLGLSGSLRAGSHNTRLLRAAAMALPPAAELVIHEALRDIPPYDQDAERDAPAPVLALRDAVTHADAVLIATPEYNNSVPGQLKNALDWLSRPFETNPLRDKPVAVIGASTGLFGAVWAQADLRRILGVIGADVLDAELPVGGADRAFAPGGQLDDPGLADALSAMLLALRARTPSPVG